MKLLPTGHKSSGKMTYTSEDGTVRVYYEEHRAGRDGERRTVGFWYAHSTVERDVCEPKVRLLDGTETHPLKMLARATTLAGLKKRLAAVTV